MKKDKDGKVIATGKRDANLDRGWLLTKLKRKKLYCPGCDRWHDTQKQVNACVLSSRRFIKVAEQKAKQEQIDENAELRKRITDLEAKLSKIMEAKDG